MNHLSLLANFFLLSAPSSSAMEITQKKPSVGVNKLLSYPTLTMQVSQGNTPLHIAAASGEIEYFRSLDKKTIDVQNYEGNTPLHIACKHRQFDIIKILIQNDAQTTIKNNNQKTALMKLCSACYPDHVETLKLFIDNHTETARKFIHTTDEYNNNQMHLCSQVDLCGIPPYIFKQYLSFLISQGISIHARNQNNKRAIDLVCDEYHNAYKNYLAHKIILKKRILINTEKLMHLFLLVTAQSTQYALFTNLLHQKDKWHKSLRRKIKNRIAYLYYILNIETIIARKYHDDDDYYNNFIENKNTIKQLLIQKPQPHLL